jgi:hypothetical protein
MLNLKYKNLLILFTLWFIVQAFLLFTFGIKTDGEAEAIIANANFFISNGHVSSPRVYLYFTESFLVFIKIKFGLANTFIVLIHLMLNLAALFSMYRFIESFYASKKNALLGCVLLLICYPYQLHNTYISTESIFFSLSCIYTFYLLQVKKYTITNTAIIFLLLISLCITRPSGLFFVAATFVYLSLRLTLKVNLFVKISALSILAVIGLLVVNYFTSSGNGYDFIIPFKEEHIICGITTLPGITEGKMANENSLLLFVNYLGHHPQQFLRLALLKSKAFFGLSRPYFSLGHNLFLIFYFYSLYFLGIAAVIKHRKLLMRRLLFFYTVIIIYWLSVVFTCDDWGNRFFITLTPFFIIMGLGLVLNKNSNQID